MNPWAAIAASAVISSYAVVSRRLSTTMLSGPMMFVSFGLVLGPLGLDLFDRRTNAELTRVLLESALALVLFTGAASIRTRQLRREYFLPVRLLAVGLPLTMAFGWLVAWLLLPGLTVWELALVAVVLAPTDAALGQQAVSDRSIPALVRHGLSVESGLNDGMAVPFFLLALAAAGDGHNGHQGPTAVFFLALVASSAIGLVVGWLGARVLRWSSARGWSVPDWRPILVLAVLVIAYALCIVVDGSGFIGAWTAGLAFGAVLRTGPVAGCSGAADEGVGGDVGFLERLGELLAALSFLIFGGAILGPSLEHVNWRMPVYAVLSLSIIRMLPVAVSLIGTGLRLPSIAYTGWFGPRGLASVVLGLIAFEEHLPGTDLLTGVVAVTVALSVYLHGASAAFLGSRYGTWYARARRRSPELREGSAESSA
ncbi:cation:proton antiporter [Streptomyces sp. NPDC059460]|uniref:cation:proton antiporter n=1 Tax=Streptomyces sp. NPDC059460 TaxID=3346840 RepID=UPI0036C9DC24